MFVVPGTFSFELVDNDKPWVDGEVVEQKAKQKNLPRWTYVPLTMIKYQVSDPISCIKLLLTS